VAVIGWRDGMSTALYGAGGFFRRERASAHFRTSAHVGPALARAILTLLEQVDDALERPERLDVVDVGAGCGELLLDLLRHSSADLRRRLRLVAVEVAARPDGLDSAVEWVAEVPAHVTGLLIATEWLDNVPLDVTEMTSAGWRYVLVDDSLGDPVTGPDLARLDRWWPTESQPDASPPYTSQPDRPQANDSQVDGALGGWARSEGVRAEVGGTRDAAWAGAVGCIDRGLALAIDYGHLRNDRPALGTLTGFRHGREVRPVPDGSCDVTAHIAADAVAAAGSAVAGLPSHLVRQTEALRALGINGRRPDLDLAHRDPGAYVRALAAASSVAELTDESGLGAHYWIYQPVGISMAAIGSPHA
jgi:SAM-dependent MidA family methyltransferase